MFYYHNLIIKEDSVGAPNDPNLGGRNSDGTLIFTLIDTHTESVFQFAVRSFAWPPGIKT
jgi:hypothetical protein